MRDMMEDEKRNQVKHRKKQSRVYLQHPALCRMLFLVVLICLAGLVTACGRTGQNTVEQSVPSQVAVETEKEQPATEQVEITGQGQPDDNTGTEVSSVHKTLDTQRTVSEPERTEKPVNETAGESAEQKEPDAMKLTDLLKKSDSEAEESPVKAEQPYSQENDAELQAMIGEVYALRTEFTGELDTLLARAKEEYRNLPEENRKSEMVKMGIRYVKIAGNLEKQCDSRMDEILGRMKAHLQEQGQDTSLTKDIRRTYEKEKTQMKSEYLDMVKSRI